MSISNGSFLDLDCSDLTGWIDKDADTGVSDQQTFDGKSCFAFDTGAGTSNSEAWRTKDVGSIEGLGNRIVLSLSLYCDRIGLLDDIDRFQLRLFRSDWRFIISFASDGLFVFDGANWNEVGTNLVVQDTWQEWTINIDLSGGVSSAVCDVYLNNVLQASSVDCSVTGTYIDGEVDIFLRGWVTANQISYLDWVKIGDDFAPTGWTGKFMGVTNPAKIMGISVANIAKVNGI